MAERSVCSFTHTHTPKHSTLSCNHEANPALKVPQGGMDGVLSFFFFLLFRSIVITSYVFCGVVMWAVIVMGAQLFRRHAVLVFQALSLSLTSVPVAISQDHADIKDSFPKDSEPPL